MTKSGDLDGTFIYSYDGQGIVEIRDGSNLVVNQVYRGTEYIDEIVAMRLEEGYAVILQDANFNVVGAVDMAGQVLERVFYEPYGLPTFEGETRHGDYDGDHSVNSTDDADLGSGQTCWGADPTGACRVFDFNFDLTLDAGDAGSSSSQGAGAAGAAGTACQG